MKLPKRLNLLGGRTERDGIPNSTIPRISIPLLKGDKPDMMVYFDDLYWRAAGTLGHSSNYLPENDTGPDDAVHSEYGVFALHLRFCSDDFEAFWTESLIIPSRMSEINWIAKRPRDSSLDTSKATKYLNEKPYTLSRALKILKEEVV